MRAATTLLLLGCLTLEASVARAQPPAQVGTPIPAPPQGVQVIVVDGAPSAPMDRQQWLELRLRELQVARSQHHVGGPIALMATGGAVALIFGVSALAFASANAIDSGGNYKHGERVTGFIALGGVAMMIAGAVLLPRRLRARHQYDPEIRDIKYELRALRQRGYGFTPVVGPRSASMAFRFSF